MSWYHTMINHDNTVLLTVIVLIFYNEHSLYMIFLIVLPFNFKLM